MAGVETGELVGHGGFVAMQVATMAIMLHAVRTWPEMDPRAGPGRRVLLLILCAQLAACLLLLAGYLIARSALHPAPGAWRLPVFLGGYVVLYLTFLPQVWFIKDEALRRLSYRRLLLFYAGFCTLIIGASFLV